MRGQARLEPASEAPKPEQKSPVVTPQPNPQPQKNWLLLREFCGKALGHDPSPVGHGFCTNYRIHVVTGLSHSGWFSYKIARLAPHKSRNNFQLMKWQKPTFYFAVFISLLIYSSSYFFFLLLKYENKFLTKGLKGKICNFSSSKIPALTVLTWNKLSLVCTPVAIHFPMPAVYTFMLFADVDWSTPLLPPAALPHVPLLNFRLTGFVITLSSTGTSLQTIPTTANLPSPRSTTTTTTIATTATTPFHPPLVYKRRRKVSWRHQCPQHSYLHIQAKKWPLSFHEEKQQPTSFAINNNNQPPFTIDYSYHN